MITTAVQQASQMVEIPGAPATTQETGDDFRATFAATVSDSTAQKSVQSNGGSASDTAVASTVPSTAKQVLAAGLLVKNTPTPAHVVTQSLPSSKDAGSEEDALGLATAAPSGQKVSADLARKNDATTHVVTGASIEGVDSRSAVLTPVGHRAREANDGSDSLPLAVNGLDTSAVAQKGAGPSKPAEALRGRKTEAADANKDLRDARAQTVVPVLVPGSVVADASVTAAGVLATQQTQVHMPIVVQATQVPIVEAGSIAQKGSNAGVVTTVLQASDDTTKGAGSSIRAADTDGFEAALDTNGAVAVKPIVNRVRIDGEAIEPTAESGLKSDPIEAGSGITKTLSGVGAPASPAIDSTDRLVSRAKQNVPGSDGAEAKTNGTAEGSLKAAVSQTRVIGASHSALPPQLSDVSQAASSKAGASAQDPPVGSGPGLQLTGISERPVKNEAAISQDAANVSQQVDGFRDAAPAREVSSKTAVSAAKDEKTKAVGVGSDDTTTTQATIALGAAGEISSGSVSNAAALVSNAAGKAVAVADAAIPISQATPHVVGPVGHTVSADAGSTIAARTLGASSTGSLAEPASSVAQAGESHRTLLATPTTLEVGVQSGTQGWLRIRAEVGDQGAVNASLTAGSGGGRELLHSQMPALNEFLHSEQMAVTTTVVDRGTLASGGHGGAALGSGGLGSQEGAGGSNGSLLQGGGAQPDGGQRESSRQVTGMSASERLRSYDALSGVNGADGSHARASLSDESGRWLNVRV